MVKQDYNAMLDSKLLKSNLCIPGTRWEAAPIEPVVDRHRQPGSPE